MIRATLFLISLIVILPIINCSEKESIIGEELTETPEQLYAIAKLDLDKELYEEAKIKFENINFKFPLSNEGIQSLLMIAFIEYAQLNYEDAIYKFDRIIKKYPSHKNIDYAYYMRAMCYFEQIKNEGLDGKNNQEALENFSQIINRFPESKYARDSQQKIIFVKENIAAKHMDIALFYLNQKKYLAALNRYNIVINEYSQSKFTPEALYREVEIYYTLGMIDDAKKTSAVIGYNYPKSKWYKYSYKLLKKNEDKSNKKSLLNKISNFLTNNDNKEK
ncbi:outer membrane protein assembly factor BamD [Alphaproteobacteria bacterium]|nr:outer membrane protein assembly factor BamD [Alphaproteobacteria bacterium]